MTLSRKLIAGAVAGVLLGSAGVAIAGTAVTGTGSSPAAAMDDANRRASQISQRQWGRGTCYTPARYESCRQQGGYWVCRAHVNNQAGSRC